MTPALLLENYGLKAEQIVEFKALRGDASDNIPGVKGIGEKGAVSLLCEYGTVDNIYAHIDEVKGALKTKLLEGKESAYMSRELARIRTDTDIPCSFDECARPKVFGPEVKKTFEWMEFRSLLKRLPIVGDVREKQPDAELVKITERSELLKLTEKASADLAVCFDENIFLSFEDGKEYEIVVTHNFLDGIRFEEALEAESGFVRQKPQDSLRLEKHEAHAGRVRYYSRKRGVGHKYNAISCGVPRFQGF